MFRTLGLRQLSITDKHNRVMGIITRADLVASHIMQQSKVVRRIAYDLMSPTSSATSLELVSSETALLNEREGDVDSSTSATGIQLSSILGVSATKRNVTSDEKYVLLDSREESTEQLAAISFATSTRRK